MGSDIRVRFGGVVNDSNVGPFGLNRLGNEPTMYIAQVQPSVILHEFGHALVLWHEHQGPDLPFARNVQAVYDQYLETHRWDEATVDANILNAMLPENAAATSFDSLSIIAYPIPPGLVLNGHPGIPWNQVLSAVDIATIAIMYGPPPAAA